MTNKLNFGILGCGMIANFHAEAIKSLGNAVLYGVADNNLDIAKNFANKYSIKAYDSYSDMLSDKNIDIVCICTPSFFHAQNAIDALRAKKHVVLEKPMATTVSDAERIILECKQSGCLLTVICQLRFSEDMQKLKQLIDQNAFGKIAFCDLYMKYWRDPSYYANGGWKGTKKFDVGGALMNQGIHGVDALLYLAGDTKLLKAKTKTHLHNIEVEDLAVAMLEFKNGALGVIEASTCVNPGFDRKIEILGSNGCAVLKEDKFEKLVINGETIIDSTAQNEVGTASDPAAMSHKLHAMQINNLINVVLGKEDLLIDCNEGLRAVKLIEEIYKEK